MKGGERPLRWGLVLLSLSLGGCQKDGNPAASGDGSGSESVAHVLAPSESDRPVGWKKVTHLQMSLRDVPMVAEMGGQTTEGKTTQISEKKILTQILDRNKKRITVQMDSEKSEVTMGETTNPAETTTGILVGERLILEKLVGEWGLSLESGRTPTDAERVELDRLLEALDPAAPNVGGPSRSLGDEWDEDAGSLGEGMIHYRFDRMESYQGQECGVFLGTIETTEKNEDGGETKLTGKARTFYSLECFEPLYNEIVGTVEVTMYPEEGRTVTIHGPVRATETSVVTLPKFH